MNRRNAKQAMDRHFNKLFALIQSLKARENPADRRNWNLASPLALANYHLSVCRDLLKDYARTVSKPLRQTARKYKCQPNR
jgi:hypothetical protein